MFYMLGYSRGGGEGGVEGGGVEGGGVGGVGGIRFIRTNVGHSA